MRRVRKGRQPRFAAVLATMSTLSLLLGSLAGIGVSQVMSQNQPDQQDSAVAPVQPADLRTQIQTLFASPDSLGSIAVGVAEGTRTPEGGRTEIWAHHSDPGNEAINQGTFAWQLGAASPEEADQKAIARILNEAVPHLLQKADQSGMVLDLDQLMQGIDLWNQAPRAGADFVENLKRCQQLGQSQKATLLCARVQSFRNATTGDLEASGFENDLALLEQDQSRRITKIQQVLAQRHPNEPAP